MNTLQSAFCKQPALRFAAMCAICFCATAAMSQSPVPNQAVKAFHFEARQTADLNYLLFLPSGYKSSGSKKWPLMLFLHGAGERGTNIALVAKHGPPRIASTNADFPFIVVSPQCPEGDHWHTDALLGLLDAVEKQNNVDEHRVYLTGLSMGGYGTWDLGLTHPDRFAAIVPICGGGQLISVFLSSHEKGAALRALGIWAFHGAKDPVVPVDESKRMIEALKRANVPDVKLTVYPEAQHDSWTETYNNPELYKWLLEHERK